MADEKRVREGKGYYRQLNQASTGELLWGSSQKRKKRIQNTDPKIFPVERVVTRRTEGTKTLYLIKWAGYSAYENSWLEEDDLSDDLVRNFEKPPVEASRLQDNLDRLRVAVEAKLKSRSRVPITIEFHHDCYRYCFGGKGSKSRDGVYILHELDDFGACNFPMGWDVYLDKNGDGVKIIYPVKIRIFLSKSVKRYKLIDDLMGEDNQRMYMEKLTIDFIRENITVT